MVVFRYNSRIPPTDSLHHPESGLLNLQDTTDYVGAAHSNLGFSCKQDRRICKRWAGKEIKLTPEKTDDALRAA